MSLACVNDYIDLQKLRLSPKTKVSMEVQGELDDRRIAPLVIMTFVENAFKHAVSNREPSVIEIRLHTTKNDIAFSCKNTLFSTLKNTERIGIGLANTKKRLNFLYPQNHFLYINNANGFYTIELILNR